MRRFAIIAAVFASNALAPVPASAQFEPPTVERGPKLEPVTVYPEPGVYTNTTAITLMGPEGSSVHYTMDGSKPTEDSPVFDPDHLIFLNGVYDGSEGLTTGYTIRAVAVQDGHTDSDPVTLTYTIERRNWTDYISEEVAPGVRMIRDSSNDKAFLIAGTESYALIDTTMGRGDLAGYVAQFTGGLPLKLIVTHSHGDHIAQASQFIENAPVYVGEPDRTSVAQFMKRQGVADATVAEQLVPVETGAKIDLGDRELEIVLVPGHTPGSLAVLDPASGNLFTGDTFGNNSPLPPDVMWLQWVQDPLDIYLANVRTARQILGSRVTHIMTGHNDRPLVGTAFLDNLETAIQRGLDEGSAALIPSWRPPDGVQLVEGDRFTNPDWFGVNVNPDTFLPAPPAENARLGFIALRGAALDQRFSPDVHSYRITRSVRGPMRLSAWPSTTKASRFTINGRAVEPGQAVPIDQGHEITIEVTSADGAHREDYTIGWPE